MLHNKIIKIKMKKSNLLYVDDFLLFFNKNSSVCGIIIYILFFFL